MAIHAYATKEQFLRKSTVMLFVVFCVAILKCELAILSSLSWIFVLKGCSGEWPCHLSATEGSQTMTQHHFKSVKRNNNKQTKEKLHKVVINEIKVYIYIYIYM